MVDEGVRFLLTALDLKCEDAAAAVREILLIQRVIGMIGQRRMVDLGDLRMILQVLDDLFGVLRMTLQAQGQRLGALEQQERSRIARI